MIPTSTNNSVIAVNRLLKAGHEVGWHGNQEFFVRFKAGLAPQLEDWARQLGIDIKASNGTTAPLRRLQAVRAGLYRPWAPNMDEGWTRWLLEQYEFPYTSVRPSEIRAGRLNARFDVIVFPEQTKDSLITGIDNEWTRPEHRGGVGPEGIAALKEFTRSGGTLITLGSSALAPIEEFPLPLRNALRGLRADQFSCPGSILRVFVDNRTPVAFGMREEASAVFYNDLAFEPTAPLGDSSVRVIAKYPAGELLKSGWIGGEQHLHDRIAAAEVTMGKGRVILLGFSVQHRAQPHGTFKLLFNSIHYAGAAQ